VNQCPTDEYGTAQQSLTYIKAARIEVDTAYLNIYRRRRCMHLHLHRDESRSGHLDLVGEGDHPWIIDLVTVIAAAILVVGFAGALVAHLVR
jgi:hypothetical protein